MVNGASSRFPKFFEKIVTVHRRDLHQTNHGRSGSSGIITSRKVGDVHEPINTL